jgi:hypothetical protein
MQRKERGVAELNVDEFLERFRERAAAVRERGVPPLEADARRAFVAQAEVDFLDYSLVGNASWSVEDGHLVLRIPLAG